MDEFPITALDGRYREKVKELGPIVSEFGLMKYRLKGMSRWIVFLERVGVASYDIDVGPILNKAVEHFSMRAYLRIKELEKITNHDVKAVEYYLRELLPESVWPWIHILCTSEDVNSVAYALMMLDAASEAEQALVGVLNELYGKALQWRDVPMLSRTHGQPATPTTVGKEMAVFINRVEKIRQRMNAVPFMAKWSGATGNFAAHSVTFPKIDWITHSSTFVESLGLEWNPLTTQIESHDMMVAYLNDIGQICGILEDLCNDVWTYISFDYFGQKVVKTETGSSTMPGKVNPIDVENARSNFRLARGLVNTMGQYLPVSSMQRDLSDSTLQRNLGPVFGHYVLALKNLKRGLGKLELRADVMARDLARHPEVLGEAVQSVLRKNGHADAYEQLKELLRGNAVTLKELSVFISDLDISKADKVQLLALRPRDYVGLSSELVDYVLG